MVVSVYQLVDFQNSPSSDSIWRGTKDFSYLIGANFTDPKTGRCAWTNQSSSQRPLGIKLSLTSTKCIETWLAVQIPTWWGRLRNWWSYIMPPFSSVMAFLDDLRLSLTPWSFRTRISFLSAQLRHKYYFKNSHWRSPFPVLTRDWNKFLFFTGRLRSSTFA